MTRLTRDGTAEPVSLYQILRQARTETEKSTFSLFSWPRAGLATLHGWSIPVLCYMWWLYMLYLPPVCTAPCPPPWPTAPWTPPGRRYFLRGPRVDRSQTFLENKKKGRHVFNVATSDKQSRKKAVSGNILETWKNTTSNTWMEIIEIQSDNG